MARLSIRLFGHFEARIGAALVDMPTRQTTLLLALLALEPDRMLSRDMLAALLWPDRGEDQARTSMRQALYRLKTALAAADPAPVEIEPRWVRLIGDAVDIDAAALDLADGPALAAISGVPLQGLETRNAELETRLGSERLRLQRRLIDRLDVLTAEAIEAHRFAEAEALANRRLSLDPFDESALRDLMVASVRQGRRNAALDAYQAMVQRLRADLSVTPAEETQALWRDIRSGDLAEAPPEPEDAAPEPAMPVAPPPAATLRHCAVLHVIVPEFGAVLSAENPEAAELARHRTLDAFDAIAAGGGGRRLGAMGNELAYAFGEIVSDEAPAVSAVQVGMEMVRTGAAGGVHAGDSITGDGIGQGPLGFLARHIARAAQPGEVRLSGLAQAECHGSIDLERMPDLEITGLGAALRLWRPVSNRTERRHGWAARRSRGLSRFVGRQAELAELDAALVRCETGARVILLTGEAGLGKSRIVHEFLHGQGDALVYRANFAARGKDSTYLALGGILRGWVGLSDTAPAREVLTAVEARIGASPAGRVLLAAAGWVLDTPVQDADWIAGSRDRRRRSLVELLATALEHRPPDRKAILVIEDIHWAADPAASVIEQLVTTLKSRGLLILMTSRPEFRPEFRTDWLRLAHVRQLRLEGLEPGALNDLVDDLIAERPGLSSLRRQLVQATGGVPLYVEEVIRALRDGDAAPAPGSAPGTRDLSGVEIPASIRGVLGLRIERLPADQRQVLEAAAVIGAQVPERLLARLTGLAPDPLAEALDGLAEAELLHRVHSFPEHVLAFNHALMLEAAYRATLPSRRQALHRQMLDLLDEGHGGRTDDHLEEMADHARFGNLWDRAAGLSERAGDRATGMSAYQRAVLHYERAIDALARLEPSRAISLRQAELYQRMRPGLMILGLFDRAYASLRKAEALFREAGDRRALAECHVHLAYFHATDSRFDAGLDCCDTAVEEARGLEDPLLHAEIEGARCQLLRMRGLFAQAVRQCGDFTDIYTGTHRAYRGPHLGTRAVWGRAHLAVCRAYLGDPDAAQVDIAEALAVAEATGRPVDLQFAWHNAAICERIEGRIDAALPLFARALDIVRRTDLDYFQAWIMGNMGEALLEAGNIDFGMQMLTEAVERKAPVTAEVLLTLARISLGKGHLLTGDLDRAETVLRRCLADSRAMGHRFFEQVALRRLACAVGQRDPEQGGHLFRAALGIAVSDGMVRDETRCRLRARDLGIDLDGIA
ncbi:TOMM system kinase/cyclase fusion protein (plasmid) [Paracoccaceae bacterium]|nr:TOMM system kinase/cyclase fusion protein [Paracoccaceae bacterium]